MDKDKVNMNAINVHLSKPAQPAKNNGGVHMQNVPTQPMMISKVIISPEGERVGIIDKEKK